MKRTIKFSLQVFLFITITILYTGQINAQKSTTETNNGLRTTKFKTNEGTITVYTPADMHAGDVISGTVFTEPEGKNDKEIKKNQDVLNGRVIEMEDKKTPVEKGEEKWQIPTFFAGLTTLLLLKDANGNVISTTEIPVDSIPRLMVTPETLSPDDYFIPPHIQAGKPFQIPGFYDGNFLTTGMTINGVSPTILAESPGVTIYETPPDLVGPSEIVLTEGDLKMKDSLNVLNIKLTAGKLNLLEGEKTKVNVKVSGLKGLKKKVTYKIKNISPNIINLKGGNEQEITINPDSSLFEGTHTKDLSVTAIDLGNWFITGNILMCPEIEILKLKKRILEVQNDRKASDLLTIAKDLGLNEEDIEEGREDRMGPILHEIDEYYRKLFQSKDYGSIKWDNRDYQPVGRFDAWRKVDDAVHGHGDNPPDPDYVFRFWKGFTAYVKNEAINNRGFLCLKHAVKWITAGALSFVSLPAAVVKIVKNVKDLIADKEDFDYNEWVLESEVNRHTAAKLLIAPLVLKAEYYKQKWEWADIDKELKKLEEECPH